MLSAFTLILFVPFLLFALRRGEQPERLVAVLLVTGVLVDRLNHALFGEPAWFTINPGHLVIDFWSFVALLWVALRANRGWPLWVCALQVIVLLGHIAKLWDLNVVRRAYWVMTQLPLFLQMLAVVIGTRAHTRRARRIGWYHSWRLA